MDENRDRQIKIGIVNKAVDIYGIFFERNYRIRIPYPAFSFNKIHFIDIVTGSATLLKFH
jgi:hypothetical protein